MINYQHILLATDLTERSESVADKALTLVQNAGSQLSIFHAFTQIPLFYSSGEFAIPADMELDEALEARARAALTRQAMRLGIPEEKRLFEKTSMVRSTLIELVQRLSVDLVIIGSHDRHGLALLTGSVADTLLHTMPCDVLAIWVGSH